MSTATLPLPVVGDVPTVSRWIRTSFGDGITAPEDVARRLRRELAGREPAWVTQVAISAAGLVAAAVREHTGGGVVRVEVVEQPLQAMVEVIHTAERGGYAVLAWALVH